MSLENHVGVYEMEKVRVREEHCYWKEQHVQRRRDEAECGVGLEEAQEPAWLKCSYTRVSSPHLAHDPLLSPFCPDL